MCRPQLVRILDPNDMDIVAPPTPGAKHDCSITDEPSNKGRGKQNSGVQKKKKESAPKKVPEGNDKVLAERFRTKKCRNFMEKGTCPYESRCMFAHGDHQLRTAEMNLRDGLVNEEAIRQFKRMMVLKAKAQAAQASHIKRAGDSMGASTSTSTAISKFSSGVYDMSSEAESSNDEDGHRKYVHNPYGFKALEPGSPHQPSNDKHPVVSFEDAFGEDEPLVAAPPPPSLPPSPVRMPPMAAQGFAAPFPPPPMPFAARVLSPPPAGPPQLPVPPMMVPPNMPPSFPPPPPPPQQQQQPAPLMSQPPPPHMAQGPKSEYQGAPFFVRNTV